MHFILSMLGELFYHSFVCLGFILTAETKFVKGFTLQVQNPREGDGIAGSSDLCMSAIACTHTIVLKFFD